MLNMTRSLCGGIRSRVHSFLVCLALMLAAGPAMAQAFPAVFSHKFGRTEVPATPGRVVSLSFIGHDFLLALGVRPVALRAWYGGHPFGVWPWAQDALGDHKPVVLRGEIDIEQVALLKPDLIVGLWSGMTADDYRLLSQIAPTIAPQERYGDYGTPWQDITRTLGRATGTQDRAEAVVSDLEARLSDIRATHPEWSGQTASIVWPAQISAFTRRDIRSRFLAELGFRTSPALDRLGGDSRFFVLVSEEDLTPIDTDLLIWIDSGGAIGHLRDMPLRPTMRARREGREVYVDPLLSAALSHSSPLSLNYVLDRLVPLISQAVDGDPKTPVDSMAQAGLLTGGGQP